MSNLWVQCLKEWNEKYNNGNYMIPRASSKEYKQIRKMMEKKKKDQVGSETIAKESVANKKSKKNAKMDKEVVPEPLAEKPKKKRSRKQKEAVEETPVADKAPKKPPRIPKKAKKEKKEVVSEKKPVVVSAGKGDLPAEAFDSSTDIEFSSDDE